MIIIIHKTLYFFGGGIKNSWAHDIVYGVYYTQASKSYQPFLKWNIKWRWRCNQEYLNKISFFARLNFEILFKKKKKKKKKDDQVALIIGPHFSLQNLVADMGNFWEKLDVSLFDALYGILYGIIMPTLEKLN